MVRRYRPRLPDTPSAAETRLYELHGGTFARAFAKLRADGQSMTDAYKYAQYITRNDTFDWSHNRRGDDCVTLPQPDGFTVIVTLESDDSPDLSWIGEFSDTWSRGAIPLERMSRDSRENGAGYRYFIPGNVTTAAELRALGVPRADADTLARSYARRDFERLRTYGNEWSMVGVSVVVTHENAPHVTLGRASVWGIESDSDRAYFEETARELIPEAMEEARAEAARLARVFVDASTHRENPPTQGDA